MSLHLMWRSWLHGFNRNTCLNVKQIHLMKCLAAKKFIDYENTHAHNIMECSPKTYQLFMPVTNEIYNISLTDAILSKYGAVEESVIKAVSQNPDKVIEDFKTIVHYCKETNTLFSDERFTYFTKHFCSNISELSDEQLLDSLKLCNLLPIEESVRAPNFIEVWNSLDLECCCRMNRWTTDQLLFISDAWYNLRLARICDFVSEALYKLGRKVVKMTPSQLVQTMFMCNVVRRSTFSTIDFETNLTKSAKEMTIDELGVISMGFFKTQTPIHNAEFLDYLYRRVTEELNTVNDITFVAILKILRYSSRLPQINQIMKLQKDIYKCRKVDKISILGCLHVALLGCELQQSHDALVESVLKRFEPEIDNTRLKDLERICLVMNIFNIKTESQVERRVAQKVIQSLQERIEEILKYPRAFTNCLHYLHLVGFHDEEMLAAVLDKKFLKHAAGSKLNMCREIFHLDTFSRINVKDYMGPQLSDKNRRAMGKLLTNYIPDRNLKYKLSATDSILLSIKDTVNIIAPFNYLKHVLPNYERADILICYDQKHRKSVPLPSDCPEDYSGTILTPDILLKDHEKNDFVTVVIVIGGWNNMVREKNRNTGLLDMKIQQLKLLGHKHIIIYWYEWRELEEHQDRLQFIKRKLSTVMKL